MASPIRSANSMIGPPVWLAAKTGRAGNHDGRDKPRADAVKRRPAFTVIVFMRFRQLRFRPRCCVRRAGRSPAAARLAKGSHCIAPSRPMRSASQPGEDRSGRQPERVVCKGQHGESGAVKRGGSQVSDHRARGSRTKPRQRTCLRQAAPAAACPRPTSSPSQSSERTRGSSPRIAAPAGSKSAPTCR